MTKLIIMEVLEFVTMTCILKSANMSIYIGQMYIYIKNETENGKKYLQIMLD